MSKQANTKLIGGFVVGAVILVAAGILLFGSGKFLTQKRQFVLFFKDSLSGLAIGSPVDFRGVKVGMVTNIRVSLSKEDFSLKIPVYIEIEPDRISMEGTEAELKKMVEAKGTKNLIELLVGQGLRAQLVMQSLVTGQLGIHLDFYPDKPVKLVGADQNFTEIPTIESSLAELAKTFRNLPLSEIADKVLKTLDSADKLLEAPEIREMIVSVKKTANSAEALLQNVNGQVKPLASNTDQTLDEIQKTFAAAGKLLKDLDARIPQLVASLEDTSKSVTMTMRGANKAVNGFAGDNSPVRAELIKTMSEFAAAARAFRVLAQYVESHPEALIRGKNK